MTISEVREGRGGHRRGRCLRIFGAVALVVSAAACNAPIPDVQVTPNYVGIVQRVVTSSVILEMTDGTTQTIDLKAQRAVYRLPYVDAGDLLLLSTAPGSLGAAALSPCHPDPDCWYMSGGGRMAPTAMS